MRAGVLKETFDCEIRRNTGHEIWQARTDSHTFLILLPQISSVHIRIELSEHGSAQPEAVCKPWPPPFYKYCISSFKVEGD